MANNSESGDVVNGFAPRPVEAIDALKEVVELLGPIEASLGGFRAAVLHYKRLVGAAGPLSAGPPPSWRMTGSPDGQHATESAVLLADLDDESAKMVLYGFAVAHARQLRNGAAQLVNAAQHALALVDAAIAEVGWPIDAAATGGQHGGQGSSV